MSENAGHLEGWMGQHILPQLSIYHTVEEIRLILCMVIYGMKGEAMSNFVRKFAIVNSPFLAPN
jgi:hypothetical protein